MKRNLHWLILGLLLLILIGYMVKGFMNVFVYSIFIYYVARREYDKITGIIGRRRLSAVIALFILVLPTVLLVSYTANVAFFEFRNFIVKYDIDVKNQILISAGEIFTDINMVEFFSLVKENRGFGTLFMSILSGAIGIIIRLLLVFIISYYMLVDGPRLRKWFLDVFFNKQSRLANEFMNQVDGDLYRVFFGNILSAAFTAIVGSIVFTLLNVIAPNEHLMIPYPVLLGLLCGIGNLIPTIGMKLVWVPLAIYLLIQTSIFGLWSGIWYFFLFLILVNIFVDIIPDLVLRPYMSGKRIHRGLLLLSYIFGPVAFGFPGLFIGPIVLILSTRFMEIVVPRIRTD